MRKLLHLHTDPDGLALPPYVSLSSLSSPSPSPYPPLHLPNFIAPESSLFHSIPVPNIVVDLATLSFIAGLLLLSLLAFAFIFHLHLRSRRAHHLRNFNSLWTLRSLLVSLASLWAVNEILRLPLVRKKHLYPFLPSITLQQQANICKLHVVLSLGFLEPGFLITLFLLVNVSIKKRNPRRMWPLVSVLTLCSPTILLQIFFVYFSPLDTQLPKFMHGSSVLSTNLFGNKTVLCTYPFFSWLIFGAFTVAYAMAFLLSCWRVMACVINKGIGHRINVLATTVMVALMVQILCLGLSWLWMPETVVYGCVVLTMFICVASCMAVGEFLLVLKPIRDALAAGGDCCQWTPDSDLQRPAEDRKHGPGL
ncbi:hypothetical protein Pfo_014615 [Paulownia fortunei]|nr:hypothetical protein Pfo_014615 [Paulownia fortunei]